MLEHTFAPRDLWPSPLTIDKDTDVAQITRLYERMLTFYLGMMEGEQHTRFTLVSPAFEVFKMKAPQLVLEKRWSNYQTTEMGDMNVASHGLRQTAITASALRFDSGQFQLVSAMQNRMLSASLLHDLGELEVHDTTYDLQQLREEKAVSEALAVANCVKECPHITPSQQTSLIEAYFYIATKANPRFIRSFIDRRSTFNEETWMQLRAFFALYERYGYLITALQQYPFKEAQELSAEELNQAGSYNRPELEQALEKGENVSETVRKLILFKNVALNQWKHLVQNAETVPSARALFNNPTTEKIMTHGNELMQLGLDPLDFFKR